MNQELDKIHQETFNIIIMSYNNVYLMFTKTIHLVTIHNVLFNHKILYTFFIFEFTTTIITSINISVSGDK